MPHQTRREFLKHSMALGFGASVFPGVQKRSNLWPKNSRGDIQVAGYYFPNYHVDPRNEAEHGKGWTEWELVKHATPRFPEHQQPKVPQWGYPDESDPEVMAMKINVAMEHGLDAFIFDWYWYDNGPFLQRCLRNGLLNARNHYRIKFALMWANHTWQNIHPHKLHTEAPDLYPGPVSPGTFLTLTNYVIEQYFSHTSYWLINESPYFSIYSLNDLLESFGGVEGTKKALHDFRIRTRKAGFYDLHLNAVVWGRQVLPGEERPVDPNRLINELGFDSVTSYVWIHHVPLKDFPQTDYRYVREQYLQYYREVEEKFDVPYFPNVTMGWDSSPRTVQSDRFINAGYPFTPVISNNSPEEFRKSLLAVTHRLNQRSDAPKIFNINCWNEWTEGSYLEPDVHHGMGYLQAIKEVCGK